MQHGSGGTRDTLRILRAEMEWRETEAKARALMHGRLAVTREDIGAMLLPVLAHRVLRNFEAEADGVAIADILTALREQIRVD